MVVTRVSRAGSVNGTGLPLGRSKSCLLRSPQLLVMYYTLQIARKEGSQLSPSKGMIEHFQGSGSANHSDFLSVIYPQIETFSVQCSIQPYGVVVCACNSSTKEGGAG